MVKGDFGVFGGWSLIRCHVRVFDYMEKYLYVWFGNVRW